jgi:hypothetical protein
VNENYIHKQRPNHLRESFSEYLDILLFSIIPYVASIAFLIKDLILVYKYRIWKYAQAT